MNKKQNWEGQKTTNNNKKLIHKKFKKIENKTEEEEAENITRIKELTIKNILEKKEMFLVLLF